MFLLLVLVTAIASGATASVVGFGIGSLLTPLLATAVGIDVAIAAVSVPHAIATAVRCWLLRAHVDRTVLVRFGLLSAAGALAGAVVYARLGPSALTRVLGGLLLLTAVAQLSGWSSTRRVKGPFPAAFGLLSGFFGGIAGNQGGLRSAAMTAFELPPKVFVATATATGLMVDLVRMPIYAWRSGDALLPHWLPIAVAVLGVLIGTVIGERILLGLSRRRFVEVVGVSVGALGMWLLIGS